MKTFLRVLALFLVIAATSSAQPLGPGVQGAAPKQASDGSTIADLVSSLNKSLVQKALNLDSTTAALCFPAAGHITNGSGAVIWRSDAHIANYRNADQYIAIGLLTQGVSNAHKVASHITIPANTVWFYRDIVAELHDSGLGTLLVAAVLSDGITPDPSASLDGSSRIYTTNSSGGTLSQMFPAVPVKDVYGTLRAIALGLRQDPTFRTNVGVVNFDSVPRTFTVRVVGDIENTFSVTVPAISMQQVAIPAGSYGDLFVQFNSSVTGFWWSAYGASVDNRTGDSWSAHAAIAF